MFLELVVIGACLNGSGCAETSDLYAKHYPTIAHSIEHSLEPYRRYYPYLYLAANRRYVMTQGRFTLDMAPDVCKAIYSFSF